jgi:hypothetical protein
VNTAPGKFYEIRLEHSYAMRALCTHYTHIPISAVSFKRRHDSQQNGTQHNDTLPKNTQHNDAESKENLQNE